MLETALTILQFLLYIVMFYVYNMLFERIKRKYRSTFGVKGSVSHLNLPNEKSSARIKIDDQLKCITAITNLDEQVFTIRLNEFRLGLVGELKETLSISSTTEQTIFFSEDVRLVEDLLETLLRENIDLAQAGLSDLANQPQSSTVSMFKNLTHTVTGAFIGVIVGAGLWIGPFFCFLGLVDSIFGLAGGSSNKT